MISHGNAPIPPGKGMFVFAELGAVSCSICAPGAVTKDEVEAFATATLGRPFGGWEAVDKSKISMGQPTPNPCNVAADRKHWFLLNGATAAGLGLETKQ
jgi:hypothetical protein